MIRRRVAARMPSAPLASRAESSVESAPSGSVKAPMAYVVAATVPMVLLDLLIDDRTVRLIPLLILLPVFPATVGTVRRTGYAVAWVLIVIPAVLLYRPLPSSYHFAIVMVLAFVLGVLCVVTCHRRIRREGELLRVRSTAVALQRRMPRSLPILTALVDDREEAMVRHNVFALQTGEPERLVTSLVLGIDTSTGTQAVNCGHPPPYLLTSGPVAPVQPGDPGVPLGLADLSPEPGTIEWFPFPTGATLISCSDGATQARSATGAFYPLAERMGAWADSSPWDDVVRPPDARPEPAHCRGTPDRHQRTRRPQD